LANKIDAATFQQLILGWFDQHGRKTLPWQQDISCYRVWISEIMLQQTQVATAIPYYERFMERFPTLASLAQTPNDEVLHYWTGLGYYARARNLHKAAKIIVEQFGGQFPEQFEDIVQLPGIGRSTAGAISAIALAKHYPILDGNVKRVLARFAAIEGWPGKPSVADQLWEIAEHYTPKKRIADYTQAIMDLGAMVCTRTKPNCNACPLSTHCVAHQQHTETKYPTSKPKKSLPIKTTIMLLIKNETGDFLLEKRPPTGIWGGLWGFPQCNATTDIKPWCASNEIDMKAQTALPEFRHTFSHYHLDIQPICITLKNTLHNIMDAQQFVWYNHTQALGLAAPVKKLLTQLRKAT
jgi:A/G-specific adenine glycosylase